MLIKASGERNFKRTQVMSKLKTKTSPPFKVQVNVKAINILDTSIIILVRGDLIPPHSYSRGKNLVRAKYHRDNCRRGPGKV